MEEQKIKKHSRKLVERAIKHQKFISNRVDQMVYKLYDLTEEEIKIVEGVITKE
ncbi:MAG: hypothetical protein KJ963_01560 [Bacteroidetes bacterium]|nr:hypothetical protein [Bacteroidota bacterium]